MTPAEIKFMELYERGCWSNNLGGLGKSAYRNRIAKDVANMLINEQLNANIKYADNGIYGGVPSKSTIKAYRAELNNVLTSKGY